MENNSAKDLCQVEYLPYASNRIPTPIAQLYRFKGYLRKHGAIATLRKLLSRLPGARSRPAPVSRPIALSRNDEVLHLKPGEWVEVKSYEEICRTLDAHGRHRGLLFMPPMAEHCGRRFRVYKNVQRILMEGTGDVRRVQNTVLLEGSFCAGLSVGCDRSCFHFWREVWLRRAGPET